MAGTSSIVYRTRPGSSTMVWRVLAGSSSTRGPKFKGSDILGLLKLPSDGRLDIELPLPASDSEGIDSDDIECPSFGSCSSKPNARAKLVIEKAPSLVASEAFRGASVPASASCGCRRFCEGGKGNDSCWLVSGPSTGVCSSGRSCKGVEVGSFERPKSNPL